jgi:hypothetical protein
MPKEGAYYAKLLSEDGHPMKGVKTSSHRIMTTGSDYEVLRSATPDDLYSPPVVAEVVAEVVVESTAQSIASPTAVVTDRLLSSIDEKLGSILALNTRDFERREQDSAHLATIASALAVLPDLAREVKSMAGSLSGLNTMIEDVRMVTRTIERHAAHGTSGSRYMNNGHRGTAPLPEPAGSA